MARKIIYGILGFVTIVILVALIWLFFIFNPNNYKQTIEAQFQQHTQMSLQINGNIDWQLMPTELILHDVAIQDSHNDVDTHWQMVEAHVSLWRLLFDRHNLLERLTLTQGQVRVQQHHFAFDHITLIPESNGFMLEVNGEFNQAPLTVRSHIELSPQQITVRDSTLEMTWADPQRSFPITVSAPQVVYAGGVQTLTVAPIDIRMANSPMRLTVSTPTLQPLVAQLRLTSPQFAVDPLVDLHGAQLSLQQLVVDADYYGDTRAGQVNITAQQATLKGINLSEISQTVQQVLGNIRQGRHLGQAIQQIQSAFAPLISQQRINPNNGMVTHFDQVLMRNRYDDKGWQTTTLQLSGNRFKLTGTGKGQFAPLAFRYPLTLQIIGSTPLSIPYTAEMTANGFQGSVDESALQKQLQPIIADALRSGLQGIFSR